MKLCLCAAAASDAKGSTCRIPISHCGLLSTCLGSTQYIRRRSWRTRQPHRQVGRVGSAGGCWPTIGVPPFATGTHLTACYLAVPARPTTSEPEDETGLKCRYPVARRGQSKLVTDDSLPWKATYFCQVLTADEGFGATKFTTDLGKTVVRRWS